MKRTTVIIALLSMYYAVSNANTTEGGVMPKDSCFYAFDETAVNGTTGTPLGGFGCGGIKYNANNGTFSSMTRPPADAFDFTPVKGAAFSVKINASETPIELKATTDRQGLPADDAIWPMHYVDMGRIQGVDIEMKGISPLDKDFDTNNMHLPYALYEFTLTNTGEKSREISLSLTWPSGTNPFKIADGNGVYNDEWSISASGLEKDAHVSGSLSNDGRTGTTTVSESLEPGNTGRVRFVVAWYNRDDAELGYYMNLYSSPDEISRHGIKVFDRLKENAEQLVAGMRGSNLPGWLTNQTLNTLSAIVLNSMFKRDGRVAFAEGQWTCFGTMDQMWLARQVMYQLVPEYAWRELEYWASTQMNNGQIHHDFNIMDVGDDKARRYYLVDKNDTEHADYRNIQKWVDLNCAMIISAYEAWQTTGDKSRLNGLWPNVKRAAQRILDQTELYGDKKYPYTFEGSENSYDAGGNPDPYNSTLSVVAYKLMSMLAAEQGEEKLAETYRQAYSNARNAFHNRYIRDKEPFMGKHCESVSAGQALALDLHIGEIMDSSDTEFILEKLDNFYYPYYWGLGYPQGTYDEWTPYIIAHYGGLMLNTGQTDRWYVMQKDAYMRQYMNRDKVFAHPLNILPVVDRPKHVSDSHRSKMQYISIPAIWRNYHDIVGFHHDVSSGDVWLTPITCPELGDSLRRGYFFTPYTMGTVDCSDSESDKGTVRLINMKCDSTINIKSLHLRNDFDGDVAITVNGIARSYTTSGTGFARELIVELEDKPYDTISVEITGKRLSYKTTTPARPEKALKAAYEPNALSPYTCIPTNKADKLAGIEIVGIDKESSYATSCNNFDYMLFSNLDFTKPGASEITLDVCNPTEMTSEVEVVMDDTSGPVIGTCKIPPTRDKWVSLSFPIKKTRGIHNIILRFFGSHPDNLMNLKSISFK